MFLWLAKALFECATLQPTLRPELCTFRRVRFGSVERAPTEGQYVSEVDEE
jgi:hypothetical protein